MAPLVTSAHDGKPTRYTLPRSQCRSCGRPIIWVKSRNRKGQLTAMPIDAEPGTGKNAVMVRVHPKDADGRIDVVRREEPGVGEHQYRWVPHHITCPDAAVWARGSKHRTIGQPLPVIQETGVTFDAESVGWDRELQIAYDHAMSKE